MRDQTGVGRVPPIEEFKLFFLSDKILLEGLLVICILTSEVETVVPLRCVDESA